MKRTLFIVLTLSFLFPASVSYADKPIDEWTKLDVMEYFQANNIVYEGEYRSDANDQYIIVGHLNSQTETVSMNFFLTRGKLDKALLLTSENDTFHFLLTRVEDQGFEKLSETNDQLGNQYKKYYLGSVELTVVNKTADWPEVYFRP